MLRWLMSWCVPARALRFHTNFTDFQSGSNDVQPGSDLTAARRSA
jgi:hypothetical protein